MSKYTTELRYICEMYAGGESKGYSDVNKIIQAAIPKVFDFDFPIFDEAYRNVLCTKILKHYYTREIAAETVGLWKLWLDTKMNEIMPYYNELYSAQRTLEKLDPLTDTKLVTKHEGNNKTVMAGTSKDEGTITGSDSNNRWDIYSDTPQGSLDNVKNEKYLTNARKITDGGSTSRNTTNDNTSSGTNDTTEKYIKTITGKSPGKSYSQLMKELLDVFTNIDARVIQDLSPLFFNLW